MRILPALQSTPDNSGENTNIRDFLRWDHTRDFPRTLRRRCQRRDVLLTTTCVADAFRNQRVSYFCNKKLHSFYDLQEICTFFLPQMRALFSNFPNRSLTREKSNLTRCPGVRRLCPKKYQDTNYWDVFRQHFTSTWHRYDSIFSWLIIFNLLLFPRLTSRTKNRYRMQRILRAVYLCYFLIIIVHSKFKINWYFEFDEDPVSLT